MHKKQPILQNQNVFAETEYNMTSLGLIPTSKLGKTINLTQLKYRIIFPTKIILDLLLSPKFDS